MKNLLVFFLLALPCMGDIQKNKIIKDHVIIIKNEDGSKKYDISPIFQTKEAFSTLVDIFIERYKKENIDGFIAYDASILPLASVLAYKRELPIYLMERKSPYISSSKKEGARYILLIDVLKDGEEIEKIVQYFSDQKMLILEVACITEDLKFKARQKIQAQVMSVFLERTNPD